MKYNEHDSPTSRYKITLDDVCLFLWVYGISTFVGYLMLNSFLYN